MKVNLKMLVIVGVAFTLCLLTTNAQTVGAINTGITDLDADLNEVNALADKDIVAFTNMIASDYNTTVSAVNNIISSGLKPAETLLAFVVGAITNKPVTDVVKTYKANKGKGWGVVAMQLGIKPGSPEFHQLKGKCKSNKDKFKKIKLDKENSTGSIEASENDQEKSDKGNLKVNDKKNEVEKSDKGNGQGNSKGKGNSNNGNGKGKGK